MGLDDYECTGSLVVEGDQLTTFSGEMYFLKLVLGLPWAYQRSDIHWGYSWRKWLRRPPWTPRRPDHASCHYAWPPPGAPARRLRRGWKARTWRLREGEAYPWALFSRWCSGCRGSPSGDTRAVAPRWSSLITIINTPQLISDDKRTEKSLLHLSELLNLSTQDTTCVSLYLFRSFWTIYNLTWHHFIWYFWFSWNQDLSLTDAGIKLFLGHFLLGNLDYCSQFWGVVSKFCYHFMVCDISIEKLFVNFVLVLSFCFFFINNALKSTVHDISNNSFISLPR